MRPPPPFWEKTTVRRIIWRIGGYLCHQMPERSFFIRGVQLPVCARCTGVYFFFFAGLALGFIFPVYLSLEQIILILILGNLPMAVDGWTQYRGWRVSNNKLRFITGGISGGTTAYLLATMLAM